MKPSLEVKLTNHQINVHLLILNFTLPQMPASIQPSINDRENSDNKREKAAFKQQTRPGDQLVHALIL